MVLLAAILLSTGTLYWALVPYILDIGLFVSLVPAGEAPWWYYGLFVDGEYIPLLVFSLLLR